MVNSIKAAKIAIISMAVGIIAMVLFNMFYESPEQRDLDAGAQMCLDKTMPILYPKVQYRVKEYRIAHSASLRWLTIFEVKAQDINHREDFYVWVCAASKEKSGWVVFQSKEAI